jgi:hypothetical protein
LEVTEGVIQPIKPARGIGGTTVGTGEFDCLVNEIYGEIVLEALLGITTAIPSKLLSMRSLHF